MAHGLDRQANGNKTMAYREGTETPWHGSDCGTITEGMTLAQMRKISGLDYSILELPSLYQFTPQATRKVPDPAPVMMEAPNRKMLVRSDTGAYLSQMSENKYEVRQPETIVEFFRDICDHGGFEIETLGALFGGAKVWCLAKRKDGKKEVKDAVTGGDVTKPYILLADSYDGSMATVARFTTVRVVCNNTLRFSERDRNTQVKVPHSKKFDADKVKAELGQIDAQFAEYMESLRAFGKVKMSNDLRERFLLKLVGGTEAAAKKDGKHFFGDTKGEGATWKRAKIDRDVLTTASENKVKEILRLAEPGNSAGSNVLPGSLYNLLQTVTYYVDHEKQSKGGMRWASAAFGQGDTLKSGALDLALSLVK